MGVENIVFYQRVKSQIVLPYILGSTKNDKWHLQVVNSAEFQLFQICQIFFCCVAQNMKYFELWFLCW